MTLRQLKIWTIVAKRQSMTKAADELRIRQPSVTQLIKALEREYGLNLYTVNGRGIEPTPTGRILLKYAKKTLLLVDNMEKEIRSSVKRRRRHR